MNPSTPSQALLNDMLVEARSEYARLGTVATVLLCLNMLAGMVILALLVSNSLTKGQATTLSVMSVFFLGSAVIAAITLLDGAPRLLPTGMANSDGPNPKQLNTDQIGTDPQKYAAMLHTVIDTVNGAVKHRRRTLSIGIAMMIMPLLALPAQLLLP